MKRKPAAKTEVHVNMTPEDRAGLEELARLECRSVNGQILHIIRTALAGRYLEPGKDGMPPLAPSEHERLRDATRAAAAARRQGN